MGPRPVEGRRRGAGRWWAAFAGSLAALSCSLSIAPPASAATEHVVGQFNMAGGNAAETGRLSGRQAPDALLASVRQRRPLFMTLQETCANWAAYLDAQLPDYRVAFHPVRQRKGGPTAKCKGNNQRYDFGNAILYRNDVGIDSSPSWWSLASPRGAEQREMLCVSSGRRKVVICSLHLSADKASAREVEASNAHEILATSYAGFRAFVGGDLNATPTSAPAGEFYHRSYGYRAAGEFKEIGSPCGNRIMPAALGSLCRAGTATLNGRKIDYLFVPPSVAVRRSAVTEAKYSDHRLLWGWIAW